MKRLAQPHAINDCDTIFVSTINDTKKTVMFISYQRDWYLR